MDEVRFRLQADDRVEQQELAVFLDGHDGVEVQTPGAVIGAPLAELVVAALITGTATLVASVVTSFTTWLVTRRPREAAPVVIVLRGLDGTSRLAAEEAQDPDLVAAALDRVGGLMEVAEEHPGRHA